VNIRIDDGIKTAILGANGAGKSTLFYHLNGIFKPKKGMVLYKNEPMVYEKEYLRRLRSEVSAVLQNPDDQIFSVTVEEDVAFGLLNAGMSVGEADVRIDEVLSAVGLSDFRMRPMRQLSYGQRKRVAFASAIATRPSVLVLDEPTAGLDSQMAQEAMETVDQMHHSGTNIIMFTHDVDLAYAWADCMHVLCGGSLIYSGDPWGFYSDSAKTAVSGLVPPTVFAIDKSLSASEEWSADPHPRTAAELLSKISGKNDTGTLYLIPVRSNISTDFWEKLPKSGVKPYIGVFGVNTRRIISGMRQDCMLGCIDSCMEEVISGNDAVLVYDDSAYGIIEKRISRIGVFGAKIKTVIL
jgi:cobalt/nickel transport system ATP-binding protein